MNILIKIGVRYALISRQEKEVKRRGVGGNAGCVLVITS